MIYSTQNTEHLPDFKSVYSLSNGYRYYLQTQWLLKIKKKSQKQAKRSRII